MGRLMGVGLNDDTAWRGAAHGWRLRGRTRNCRGSGFRSQRL